MARKTVRFNSSGISELPNQQPVVYKILTDAGKNNYTGVAKRGRVQERLQDHLGTGNDRIPGAKVVIEQVASISEARAKEQRIISRAQPKYNKQGK